jgi:hypothetical protein
VLWFAYDRWGSHYHKFDRTAIPLKNSLSQELLHISVSPLASVLVAPDIFQPAPSVLALLFAYDRWGSHPMPQATATTTFTQRLYRSRNPQARSFYIYITFIWLATAAFRFVFIERRAFRCCGLPVIVGVLSPCPTQLPKL